MSLLATSGIIATRTVMFSRQRTERIAMNSSGYYEKVNAMSNLFSKIKQVVPTLPDDEVSTFIRETQTRVLRRGERLVSAGQTVDTLFFILEGAFRGYLLQQSKEINTQFYFENSFAGAFTSFLTRAVTSFNIEAVEDSSVQCMTRLQLEKYYETNPLWYALGKHIYEIEFVGRCNRVTSFLLLDATQRYIQLLEEFPGIEGRIPGYHIASYLGIQPESFSRIRSSKNAQRISIL